MSGSGEFPIWKQWLLALVIQVGVWLPSSFLQTERFYDLTGAGTYIAITLLALRDSSNASWRATAIAAFELLWAGRLGLYLFARVLGHEDVRFAKVKAKPMTFLVYWVMQALWIVAINLPIALTLAYGRQSGDERVSAVDAIGVALFAVGFLFEAIADWQKAQFKADPRNHGKFIRTGLWAISRHPNYFGEIVLQLGIAVFAAAQLDGALFLLPFVAPTFISWLLLRVSGVPLLERIGDKRWGTDADYKQYKAKTAILVPFVY
jgi:steroid 5-alpha reductase family enzyme